MRRASNPNQRFAARSRKSSDDIILDSESAAADDSRFAEHVRYFAEVAHGRERLGKMPKTDAFYLPSSNTRPSLRRAFSAAASRFRRACASPKTVRCLVSTSVSGLPLRIVSWLTGSPARSISRYQRMDGLNNNVTMGTS
jgi:hypothetical protein